MNAKKAEKTRSADGAITRSLFQKTVVTMFVAEVSCGTTAIIDGILRSSQCGHEVEVVIPEI